MMFNDRYHNLDRNNIARMIAILICGTIFGSTFYIYDNIHTKDEIIIAKAEDGTKEYKWSKKAVEEGTTVNATYLWPDETNPSFTTIYRDGKLLSDEKMVTITAGSAYHFRGISDESILYTEVYVGSVSELDITTGESGTWYNLLPSTIRACFENEGWTWQTGWEYTGRAYLDKENSRVMIKTNDPTAVLYGIGLYLDNINNYSNDKAFNQEGTGFTDHFGSTENLFASALEYYYTKGGELRSICPKIYAMIAEIMSELDNETAQIRNDTITSKESNTKPDAKIENKISINEPRLMTELLDYVNTTRTQAGLNTVTWDSANDNNILIRMKEISELFSQNRPDGTDAFSAYTDAVMCEIRITDADTTSDIFDSAASYFLMRNLVSFNCAVYGNITVLIFVW